MFGLLKIFTLFISIFAVVLPFLYGSTNYQHLCFRLLHSALSIKNSVVLDAARPILSAEYRAMEDIVRMKSPPKRDSLVDPMVYVKNLRSSFIMSILIPKPPQCEINNETFEYNGYAVHTYWVHYRARKLQRNSDKLLLYFHGGAYVSGDIRGK